MQEYRVILTENAMADLRNIRNYITAFSSEWEANIATERIYRKLSSLNFAPERTEPFGRDRHGRPLRTVIGGKYRIIYAVDRKAREVLIAHIVSIAVDPNPETA